MKDNVKFWIQTLIIPAVLAFIGYMINNTLQEKQRSFDKMKFTDQVLNEAFDSKNPDKAFAIAKLIPQIVEDPVFADTLIALINRHYISLAQAATQSGNDTLYSQISAAAKSNQVETVSDSLRKNPITSKAEIATSYENVGLQLLQMGKLEEAKRNFDKAEQTYPGFHSSYEISKLIDTKVQDIKAGGDSNQAKQELMSAVRKNYAWKLPTTMLQKQ